MRIVPITNYDFIMLAMSKVTDPTNKDVIRECAAMLPTCLLRSKMSDEMRFSRNDILTLFEMNYHENESALKNAREVASINEEDVKRVSEWWHNPIGLAMFHACDGESLDYPIIDWNAFVESLIYRKFDTRKFLRERGQLNESDSFIDWAIQVALDMKKLKANEKRFLIYVGFMQV
jgi:hypothetical protein